MGSRYPHLSENSPGESIGVVLPTLGKGAGMGSGPITVDTRLRTVIFCILQWTPALTRRQSHDLLFFITMRLHSENQRRYGLRLTVRQSALADNGSVYRKWSHRLPAQPKDEEWITCRAHNHSALLHTSSNEEDIAWW